MTFCTASRLSCNSNAACSGTISVWRSSCLMAGNNNGGPAMSCWAISRALARPWPLGTTWLARPQCLASPASIQRPVIRNSPATWYGIRRRSLMGPASASPPTLIPGSANFACSSIPMMSDPSTISKPPPQAMPLTAAMRGLSRLRGWFRPPNPPAPQSSSDSSPPAAPFRSQPGEKKRSPAPVTMATRSAGSSRNCVNTSFRRRLAARSMAFAFGRSMVTSKTAPWVAVLTPSDMSVFLQADQCVDCHGARAPRAHDDGIEVQFHQPLEVGRGVAGAGESSLHQRSDVRRRAATVTGEEPGEFESAQRRLDGGGGERPQDSHAVAQQLREHAPGPQHQPLSQLRIDAHTDQHLRDTLAHHLLDEQRRGQRGQALRGGGGGGGAAHVEHHCAELGLVFQLAAHGLDHHRKSERRGRLARIRGADEP